MIKAVILSNCSTLTLATLVLERCLSLQVTECFRYELPHDKTNKMASAPSEDSDQPRHPPSLIIRCPHEGSLGPELPVECTAKTVIRLGRCPG